MAQRDPTRPQLDFPELVAELITRLRLTGQVGLLDFSDQVVPAFLIGSRGIDFGGASPVFTSAETFFGELQDPAISAIVVDTGPLPEGTYDFTANLSLSGSATLGGVLGPLRLEHRNAANNATLATLLGVTMKTPETNGTTVLPVLGYTIALNERFQIISPAVAMIGSVSGTIFAARRPTP